LKDYSTIFRGRQSQASLHGLLDPEGVGSMILRNVGNYVVGQKYIMVLEVK
jgi:hypothetical protein